MQARQSLPPIKHCRDQRGITGNACFCTHTGMVCQLGRCYHIPISVLEYARAFAAVFTRSFNWWSCYLDSLTCYLAMIVTRCGLGASFNPLSTVSASHTSHRWLGSYRKVSIVMSASPHHHSNKPWPVQFRGKESHSVDDAD